FLDHASAAFKDSFHFLQCQRTFSTEYCQSVLPVNEIPFGVADTRAGGSRTAVAAATIFHAWMVYIPLKRRDTARDALDLISYGNFSSRTVSPEPRDRTAKAMLCSRCG